MKKNLFKNKEEEEFSPLQSNFARDEEQMRASGHKRDVRSGCYGLLPWMMNNTLERTKEEEGLPQSLSLFLCSWKNLYCVPQNTIEKEYKKKFKGVNAAAKSRL